eukprot:UN21971
MIRSVYSNAVKGVFIGIFVGIGFYHTAIRRPDLVFKRARNLKPYHIFVCPLIAAPFGSF